MALAFAGSAIAQNAGKMDRFDDWKPVAGNTNWLLIAGALDPPRNIEISKRRNRDHNRLGNFLPGVTQDLGLMQAVIGGKPGTFLHSILMDMKNLKKEKVKTEIKDLFEACKKSNRAPILYYSGHGQTGTGDWCFSDGTLSILEIEALVIGSNYPLIISDACFSGNWANHCIREAKDGYHCLAACPDFSTANDLGEGGELTLWMCGKLDRLGGWVEGRPRTEPVYSKGNHNDFPITVGYNLIDYNGFLSSMLMNTERVLISQSVCDGTFSGIFAPHDQFNPRPATHWGAKSTHEGFMQYVKELKNANKNIYSLACDDQFGFGVFAIQNFGTEQRVTCSSDTSNIQKWYDEGYRITACGARHSTFYCVLTKGANGFSGKGQTCFRRESWQGIDEEIAKKSKEGKIITSICYSTGLKKYLVVMTESTAGQQLRWRTGNYKEDSKWTDERCEEGLHPTIVFKDPTSKKVLFVSTTDENRTQGYTAKYNYPLKK